jgi:hypothetical protein
MKPLCLHYMPRALDRCGRPLGHRGKHANIDAVARERATQNDRAMRYRATAKGQLASIRCKAKERG